MRNAVVAAVNFCEGLVVTLAASVADFDFDFHQ